MSRSKIPVPLDQIETFCRDNRIRKISFFGPVLRDGFSPGGEVDVLVEFESNETRGLSFFGLEQELSEILGHRALLYTASLLSGRFRDHVLSEAEVQYVRD